MKRHGKEERHPLEFLTDEQLTKLLDEQNISYSETNHNNIKRRIKNKSHQSVGIRSGIKNMLNGHRGLILVCALVFLVPTVALGVNKLWEITTHQEGFLTTIGVSGRKVSDTPYKLSATYVPEGLTEMPNTDGQKFWFQSTHDGGFSLMLVKPTEKNNYSLRYSEGVEEEVVNGKSVYFVNRTGMLNNQFDKLALVFFEKEERIVELMFDTELTKEEQVSIINGLKLTEVAEDEATPVVEENTENDIILQENTLLEKNSSNLFKAREAFYSNVDSASSMDKQVKVKLTLTDEVTSDEIIDLSKKQETDFSSGLEMLKKNNLLETEGQLLPFVGDIYERGDGKSTMDKLVTSVSVQPVYREFQFELTNPTAEETASIYFAPTLKRMVEGDKGYQNVDNTKYMRPIDFIGEPIYIDAHGKDKSYYNIGKLNPNETKKITIGYISINPQNDLEMLNINLLGEGELEMNDDNQQWILLDS